VLQNNQGNWFYALKYMAGEDVAEGTDNFEDARAAWLEWGRNNNQVSGAWTFVLPPIYPKSTR
jgi:hypothetical protein